MTPQVSPSTESRRLDLLHQHLMADSYLGLLYEWLQRPDVGIGVSVTLIVGGLLVRGTLARAQRFGKDADEKIARGLETASVSTDDPGAGAAVRSHLSQAMRDGHLLENLATSSHRDYQHAREKLDAYFETQSDSLPVSIDEVPAELWVDVLLAEVPPPVLTLENAELLHEGAGWSTVGYMRVHTSHVAGWWINPVG